MDFEMNEDQQAILEAVDRLLEQNAGPARAIKLQPDNAYDIELHDQLVESGFADIVRDDSMTGLDAALVVEAVARAAGVVAIGAQAMVAPAIAEDAIAGPIALTLENKPGVSTYSPVRYGAHAKTLLILGDNDVKQVTLQAGDMEPIRSNFGYPMGRLTKDVSTNATSLGADAAQSMRNWWRLSLAVEAVGTMEAALNQTVDYLKQRRQFGRTIGSFQAVQHRLSLCAIQVEGSRWLSREAAYKNAPTESVATACAFALSAADQVFMETHQLSGAIGFTREYNLHVWSMRLQALRQELGGVSGHRRALVEARWGKNKSGSNQSGSNAA